MNYYGKRMENKMSPMKDPREFWTRDTEILESISTDKIFKSKWLLPDVKDEEGNNLFQAIMMYILKYGLKSWMIGYLNLDVEWGSIPELKEYRNQLFKTYPKPFGGRKAYVAKLQIQYLDVEVKDEKGNVKMQTLIFCEVCGTVPEDLTKTECLNCGGKIIKKEVSIKEKQPRITIPTKAGGRVVAQITMFHNKNLGWKEEWAKPDEVKEVDQKTGSYVKKPTENTQFKEIYRFASISSFISEDLMNKIETFTKLYLSKDPTIPQEFFCILIGGDIIKKESSKDGKTYTNLNLNIDDVI